MGAFRVPSPKGEPMKVNVEIECTPEEARRFMGLPDVEQANAAYVDAMTSAMKGESNVDQLDEYAKKLAPMGQFGLKLFQDFMSSAVQQAGQSKSGKREDDSGKPGE